MRHAPRTAQVMMPRPRSSVAVILVAVAAAACGGDSTGPTPTSPPTLNQALTELSIPALAVGGYALAGIDGPAPSLDPSACSYSVADQGFVCTPISSNGITIGQSFTLYGSSGLQSAFDASTSSIHSTALINGNSVGEGISLTVSGRQETTLSGLNTSRHLLNGWSSIRIGGTITDETSTYPVDVTVSTSFLDLLVPANANGSQIWPSSGSLFADIIGSIGPTYLNQHTEITFAGTSSAYVSVSGGGVGKKTCRVDLAVAQAVC
jgi:hypothetical protein